MDIKQRIEIAGKIIPQIGAAARTGMDVEVLDRMLRDAMDVSELPGQPTMTLPEAFEQLERIHGGFRDFYHAVNETMRKERVQAGVTHIQAIFADIEDAAAVHYTPNLRELCSMEPNVAVRLKELVGAVEDLRESAMHCKNLGKDLTTAIEKIEESTFVQEAEMRAYARKHSLKMA